ncbi:carboxyltransferase domain-containing protein [Aliiruegeria lutimaris]|uniref:Allophanate hydrolase subunit 1 n=1 Tax=Aliiruegeria lutimaris TaxID=571298 RepID=A0A1G9MB03_9RHOB|nr:carboxyltransferase domain-containing protein [Aliiruegeria lutimaris]SDL71428.1 Allophanate hydrolase subunit 1 [Aliiruegeria lutimaris]
MTPRFKAIADHTLLVTFADEISDEACGAVPALDADLAAQAAGGMIEPVPAMINLPVSFDPLVTDHDAMETHVRGCLGAPITIQSAGVTRRVQVCYEDPFSSDLGLFHPPKA